MILIADSGSTKTTWMEVKSDNKIVTDGLNPHFTSDEQFLAACSTVRQQLVLHSPLSALHFYGAGCGTADQRERVRELLRKAFGTSEVHVETDMLGACRAVCGDRPGLVGILGTGSNACYYDGEKVAGQAVSTGYILGDHGSANHVGRCLLQDYLTRWMPDKVRTLFNNFFPMTDAEFMEAVYHKPNPNRFLASLAPFAVMHGDMDYCGTLLDECLREWGFYQLDKLRRENESYRLSVVGGFAARLGAHLERFAHLSGLELGNVVADPIEGLRQYHIKKI